MQITLKTTILASTALAVMLNLIQFAVTYRSPARADASWVDVAAKQIAPTPKPAAPKARAIATETNTETTAGATLTAASDTMTTAVAAKLSAAGLKPDYAANYLDVQTKTGTPWQLLAAVHKVETGQRGDTAVKSYAGATGPMQFMPRTFAHYAMDGDGDGVKQITDLDDALLSAGNYLRAGGADKGKYNTALYNYNHSNAYVNKVLSIARKLGL
jgi:membrane-bound lytic murein transglycosylase B